MAETLKEMMTAYVTGCLDNANLVQFLDYIDSGGEINSDELGELQNVAALIPIILEDENPPASLQNKIFQQIPDNEAHQKVITKTKKAHLREILESKKKEAVNESTPEDIEIQVPEEVSFKSASKKKKKEIEDVKPEESLPKIESDGDEKTPSDEIDEAPKSKVTVKSTFKEDEVSDEEKDESPEEEPIFAPKTEKRKKEKVTVPREEDSEPYSHVTIKKTIRSTMIVPPDEKEIEGGEITIPVEECEESRDSFLNSRTAKIVTAASILLAIILLILYFSTKSNLSEKVASLQKEKTVLQTEVSAKNDFISSNLPLIESFNQKDLIVVPLAGTEDQGGYDARVLLSPSNRTGVLQFLKIPKVSDKESLQLWLISKGQSYSVGIFHPKKEEKFYPLNKIPHIPFEEIEMFRMTKEPASGSEFPSGNTVYFGAFPVK